MHRAAVPARARRGLLRPLPAMDLPFLILVLTLGGFGLVMLYSASSAVALYRRGDAWAYVRPQLLYAAMGIGAMWAASRVDYHIYHKLAWPLLALSLVLLVVVLFMPEYNGCKRWLVLPGLGTLQPSEIAKFAVVLVFAHIISLNHSRMESFAVGVVPFALVLGAVAVLMLLEPHLSGTVLILGIGAVLMFVGGTGLRWFVLAGVGGAGAIGAAIVMRPSKSVMDFNVKSLKKKYKDKRFAAGCSREVIQQGAELLGWDLDKLLDMTLRAMQATEADIEAQMA